MRRILVLELSRGGKKNMIFFKLWGKKNFDFEIYILFMEKNKII